ncbi:MAG: hypothetical protein R2771_15810 [Saprospiraceae bacterium]
MNIQVGESLYPTAQQVVPECEPPPERSIGGLLDVLQGESFSGGT